MADVIDHLFDDDDITAMLRYDPFTIERLKRERSKNRITLINDSEIFILTADVRTLSKQALNLMGFGATDVIADESGLIPDIMFSKILRMVGGVPNGKLIKIGNTFERNHFFKSLHSERYEKLIIDYKQGLSEGRITQEFLDEAREDMPPMDFQIFYECKFPEGGAEDSLIPYDWIRLAIDQEIPEGDMQAGLDVARFGRDSSIYLLRSGGRVVKIKESQKIDTMALVGWVGNEIAEDKAKSVVDVVGIGSGVYDRLEELGNDVFPFNGGETPTDDEAKNKFYNLRAEAYWALRDWFKPDKEGRSNISIPNDPNLIQELVELRYKYSSERKIRIEDKEEMKKRIGRSPDRADALSLAFFDLKGREPELIIC